MSWWGFKPSVNTEHSNRTQGSHTASMGSVPDNDLCPSATATWATMATDSQGHRQVILAISANHHTRTGSIWYELAITAPSTRVKRGKTSADGSAAHIKSQQSSKYQRGRASCCRTPTQQDEPLCYGTTTATSAGGSPAQLLVGWEKKKPNTLSDPEMWRLSSNKASALTAGME